MYSPVSLEAQKLITMSIGKINASRVTRAGNSLHKSLLVASVLQRARNVYLDEERERSLRYPQCPPSPPQVTVTPVTPSHTSPSENSDCGDKESNVFECSGVSERVGVMGAEGSNITKTTTTTTTVTSLSNTTTTCTSTSRKRRRVSEQETAAAVSSILPKRLRREDDEEECPETTPLPYTTTDDDVTPLRQTPSPTHRDSPAPTTEDPATSSSEEDLSASSEDSDSDEDSASDTSTSSSGDEDNEMQVEQLTSLVEYFTFNKVQKQKDYLTPIHQTQSSTPIVALTA